MEKRERKEVGEGIIPALRGWWISGFLDSSQPLLPHAAVATPFLSPSNPPVKVQNITQRQKKKGRGLGGGVKRDLQSSPTSLVH